MIGVRVDLSLWREFIHDLRQILGQERGGLRRVDPHFRRKRADLIGAEHFLNLIGRDCLVFSSPDPGSKGVTCAALRKFVRQALQSTILFEKRPDDSDQSSRSARFASFSRHRADY